MLSKWDIFFTDYNQKCLFHSQPFTWTFRIVSACYWHLLHTACYINISSCSLWVVGFTATLAGMLSIWVLKWGPWRNPGKPLSPIYPLPVIPFIWPCLSRKCFRQNFHHTITDLWFLLWNHVIWYKLYLCNGVTQITIWDTFLQCGAMMSLLGHISLSVW